MFKFVVTVNGVKREGIFICSCDAVIDAIERNPDALSISVKGAELIKSEQLIGNNKGRYDTKLKKIFTD